jgi:hypothetical protein
MRESAAMPQSLYPNAGTRRISNAIRDIVADSSLKLFQNDAVVTVGTVIGDLVEATFDGYDFAPLTGVGMVYNDPVRGGSSFLASIQFNFVPAGGTPVTNLIYGYFVEDEFATAIAVTKFDGPVPMAALGDSIPVTVVINFGN